MTDFKECIQKFISKTNEIVIKLEDKITEVESHQEKCNIAKTTGATIGGIGAVATIAGLFLAPVTFGASLSMCLKKISSVFCFYTFICKYLNYLTVVNLQ
jgi:hypothetical protein